VAPIQIKASLLWRDILRRDPEGLFGGLAAQLHFRNWGDKIPQPGYVGSQYAPGGIVFVSMNPGGGPADGLGESDLRQYKMLEELRDSTPTQSASVFKKLCALLSEEMPRWKIYRNFVAPILEPLSIPFSTVSYLNLLKWRTKSSKKLARLYEISWRDHTLAQFELLSPGTIIAIGVDAGNSFLKLYAGRATIDVIPRVIGNNVGSPGREAISRISKRLGDRIANVT
jgi:hypothetical protein